LERPSLAISSEDYIESHSSGGPFDPPLRIG